jgi:hypothetical protein
MKAKSQELKGSAQRGIILIAETSCQVNGLKSISLNGERLFWRRDEQSVGR